MSFFQPHSARQIAEQINRIVGIWDGLSAAKKATGQYINPDEPLVLSTKNPDVQFDDDADDDYRYNYFHVQSIGGGGETDEDGNECGHDGMQLDAMDIEPLKFLYNGRRV
jgi:hypothetical protein